jgi:hypothetical protein
LNFFKFPKLTKTIFILLLTSFFVSFLFYLSFIDFIENKDARYRTGAFGPEITVNEKKETECSRFKGENIAVIMAMGASNSGNYGRTRFKPKSNVYDYNHKTGKCYITNDPLLGASGMGGSVWSRLGEYLIKFNDYKHVLIIPLGTGYNATNASGNTRLYEIITATQNKLSKNGIKISHIVFAQGEHDTDLHGNETSPAIYVENSKKMIADVREIGILAPMYFSISTYCNGHESQKIREAQRSLAKEPTIFLGAETDKIKTKWYRADNCHFSNLGLKEASQMWYSAITGRTHKIEFFIDLIEDWLTKSFILLEPYYQWFCKWLFNIPRLGPSKGTD